MLSRRGRCGMARALGSLVALFEGHASLGQGADHEVPFGMLCDCRGLVVEFPESFRRGFPTGQDLEAKRLAGASERLGPTELLTRSGPVFAKLLERSLQEH